MDIKKYVFKLLRESNINDINIPSFSRKYVEKLLTDVITYVDNTATIGNIVAKEFSDINLKVYQEITGPNINLSGIGGNIEPLIGFSDCYSGLGISEDGMLVTESLLDFLNLNNGLFVVQLSINKEEELSLNPPQSGDGLNKEVFSNYPTLFEVPIIFSFGTVNFYISNKN